MMAARTKNSDLYKPSKINVIINKKIANLNPSLLPRKPRKSRIPRKPRKPPANSEIINTMANEAKLSDSETQNSTANEGEIINIMANEDELSDSATQNYAANEGVFSSDSETEDQSYDLNNPETGNLDDLLNLDDVDLGFLNNVDFFPELR